MGEVINWPVVARPIPIETEDGEDPHTIALKTFKQWVYFVIKHCGIAWTEKVLLAELSFVRARRMEHKS